MPIQNHIVAGLSDSHVGIVMVDHQMSLFRLVGLAGGGLLLEGHLLAEEGRHPRRRGHHPWHEKHVLLLVLRIHLFEYIKLYIFY